MVEGLTFSAAQPRAAGSKVRKISPCQRDRRSRHGRVEVEDRLHAGIDQRRSRRHDITHEDPGDSSGEAIPVPISNTEVKLSSAEDTQGAAPRENRSSPGSFAFSPHLKDRRHRRSLRRWWGRMESEAVSSARAV